MHESLAELTRALKEFRAAYRNLEYQREKNAFYNHEEELR